MKITEVRVKMLDESSERLLAFCSVTIDDSFVVRDLKIIDGASGPFVAMPSRKLTDKCRKCGFKNHLRARFCNECGVRLNENRAPRDEDGRVKLHSDVAHPINAEARDAIEEAVIEAYNREVDLCEEPNYVPKEDDSFDIESDPVDSSPLSRATPGGFDEFIEEVRISVKQRGGAKESKSQPSKQEQREPAVQSNRSKPPAPSKQAPQLTSPIRQTVSKPSEVKPVQPTMVPKPKPAAVRPAPLPPPAPTQSTDGFAAGIF